jgi:DNA-directed RNA polymerase specialized sigma24 family protein
MSQAQNTSSPDSILSATERKSDGLNEEFDRIAAEFYTLASMLIGEGEESVELVETAIGNSEISSGDNQGQARTSSRRALSRAALRVLEQRSPGCLAAPNGLEPVHTCIEDEDLDSVGVSAQEFSRMLVGPDRDRVRTWLGSLSTEQRVIFVLRAVAGFSSTETASILANDGGPRATGWSPDMVREIFRQALCSLASQLIHSIGR